jgi:hypothetical protein
MPQLLRLIQLWDITEAISAGHISLLHGCYGVYPFANADQTLGR